MGAWEPRYRDAKRHAAGLSALGPNHSPLSVSLGCPQHRQTPSSDPSTELGVAAQAERGSSGLLGHPQRTALCRVTSKPNKDACTKHLASCKTWEPNRANVAPTGPPCRILTSAFLWRAPSLPQSPCPHDPSCSSQCPGNQRAQPHPTPPVLVPASLHWLSCPTPSFPEAAVATPIPLETSKALPAACPKEQSQMARTATLMPPHLRLHHCANLSRIQGHLCFLTQALEGWGHIARREQSHL